MSSDQPDASLFAQICDGQLKLQGLREEMTKMEAILVPKVDSNLHPAIHWLENQKPALIDRVYRDIKQISPQVEEENIMDVCFQSSRWIEDIRASIVLQKESLKGAKPLRIPDPSLYFQALRSIEESIPLNMNKLSRNKIVSRLNELKGRI